jgi:hypothetical protein
MLRAEIEQWLTILNCDWVVFAIKLLPNRGGRAPTLPIPRMKAAIAGATRVGIARQSEGAANFAFWGRLAASRDRLSNASGPQSGT